MIRKYDCSPNVNPLNVCLDSLISNHVSCWWSKLFQVPPIYEFSHLGNNKRKIIVSSPDHRCPCRQWLGFPPRCTSWSGASLGSSPILAPIRATCKFSKSQRPINIITQHIADWKRILSHLDRLLKVLHVNLAALVDICKCSYAII